MDVDGRRGGGLAVGAYGLGHEHVVAGLQTLPHFDLMLRPDCCQVRDEARAAQYDRFEAFFAERGSPEYMELLCYNTTISIIMMVIIF